MSQDKSPRVLGDVNKQNRKVTVLVLGDKDPDIMID